MSPYQLKDALHHIAWVTHCFRGSCNIYESDGQEFTAVCDFPDNQLVTMNVSPFLQECRKRIMTTSPGIIMEERARQELSIQDGPGSSRIHRLFLRVRHESNE